MESCYGVAFPVGLARRAWVAFLVMGLALGLALTGNKVMWGYLIGPPKPYPFNDQLGPVTAVAALEDGQFSVLASEEAELWLSRKKYCDRLSCSAWFSDCPPDAVFTWLEDRLRCGVKRLEPQAQEPPSLALGSALSEPSVQQVCTLHHNREGCWQTGSALLVQRGKQLILAISLVSSGRLDDDDRHDVVEAEFTVNSDLSLRLLQLQTFAFDVAGLEGIGLLKTSLWFSAIISVAWLFVVLTLRLLQGSFSFLAAH